MPDREHHPEWQYACPAVTYLLLVTAGPRNALMPFAWDTDLEALDERAKNLAGVIVALPVVRCHLPSTGEWDI